MPCSCIELETQHGRGNCKCVHYRKNFPDCACEQESVSEYSPHTVSAGEELVRTIFKEGDIDSNGNIKPSYFRRDIEKRGFSVDRLNSTTLEDLMERKRQDPRYDNYLSYISTNSSDVRNLKMDDKRLFCIYDTATVENEIHADICQNIYFEPGTKDRKSKMMDVAWRLSSIFCTPQSVPTLSSC